MARAKLGQIEVHFRGLDTDILYEIDDDGGVDWWFADPILNLEIEASLVEEERIVEACWEDSQL